MYKLALAFVSLILLVATPAAAARQILQDNWVVTQLSGDARVVHPGAQPASLKVNNRLAPGDMLLTGPSGRATLVRGGDYIIVAPHSELKLPSTPQPSGFTRVIQNLGTLLFKVQHTGIPHFAVDTPMLAAVVKGTTFTVVVDQHRSAVQVIQGVVQVSAINGGMMRMVEGGRTVFVNHDHPRMLLDADKVLPATSSPNATTVSVSASGQIAVSLDRDAYRRPAACGFELAAAECAAGTGGSRCEHFSCTDAIEQTNSRHFGNRLDAGDLNNHYLPRERGAGNRCYQHDHRVDASGNHADSDCSRFERSGGCRAIGDNSCSHGSRRDNRQRQHTGSNGARGHDTNRRFRQSRSVASARRLSSCRLSRHRPSRFRPSQSAASARRLSPFPRSRHRPLRLPVSRSAVSAHRSSQCPRSRHRRSRLRPSQSAASARRLSQFPRSRHRPSRFRPSRLAQTADRAA